METDIEYWRQRANDYEWLYRQQKDITDGYKKIIDDYTKMLRLNEKKETDM